MLFSTSSRKHTQIHRCYYLNVGSLICGFLGNLFLLFNFTQRIRYIIALPATIIFWYLATGFLISITACMEIYAPPDRPSQTYTQGFWYAIAAASFYLLCSMLLMINMLGFFLGHYPEDFALSDSQRTLILQTMVFFIWLGGGAAIFSKIESDAGEPGWAFVDAMYFCDVTILTVGFGDLYPTTNLGRGIVFPFSVGGIITLALIVSSIYKFMREIGEENIIMKHTERIRSRTVERTVTSSFDLRQLEHAEHRLIRRRSLEHIKPTISRPMEPRAMHATLGDAGRKIAMLPNPLKKNRKPRPLILKEEKDRFKTMRRIQHKTRKYRQWLALSFSSTAFGILWGIGAVVFWQAEKHVQDMTYFKALYFCYISLLTIGYGDFAPKSNAGRCFFVVWSLIAVPTMTILISDLGDTVVDKFKKWSDQLADFTVLPKYGIWRKFLNKHPWLLRCLQNRLAKRAAKKRLKKGFEIEEPDAPQGDIGRDVAETGEHIDARANTAMTAHNTPDEHSQLTLTHCLALSIKRVAADINLPKPKRYGFEEWVEFMRLIRHTAHKGEATGASNEEDEHGLLDWDWIGTDSPLMSGLSEPQWLLNRLCESLVRLEKKGSAPSEGEVLRRHAGSTEASGASEPGEGVS